MEYKSFNDFVGNTGQDMKMNPMDYATATSHILKADAILNKIDNINPNKCNQKCNGVYQIN
jgi:hypothetical protein